MLPAFFFVRVLYLLLVPYLFFGGMRLPAEDASHIEMPVSVFHTKRPVPENLTAVTVSVLSSSGASKSILLSANLAPS